MNLITKNLVLVGVAALLAVPTALQLRSEAETFVRACEAGHFEDISKPGDC